MRAQILLLLVAALLPAATQYIGDALDHRIAKLSVDANGCTYIAGARYIDSTSDVYVLKFDPAGNPLAKATFSGKGHDRAMALAVDRQGYVYLAGLTSSANWPLRNPLQADASTRGTSAFLMKLSPDLSQVLYSTYFGGRQGQTTPNALAVDSLGNLYVAGSTTSPDFPVTSGLPAGRVTPSIAGVYGAFLTKLAPAGDRIVYSALVAGNAVACTGGSSCFLSTRMTTANAVGLDAAGNAYAAGYANVTDLPTTPGAFLERGLGGFAFQINAAGTALTFLTYLSSQANLAGAYTSAVTAMVLDPAGGLVLAGWTTDPLFPTTPGALQSLLLRTDAFVAKLRPDGKSLAWSTLLGRSQQDAATSLALDAAGRVWFTGTTASPDFPNSNTWTSGEEFVAALDPVSMRLEYAARYPFGSVAQSLAAGPGSLMSLGGALGLWTRLTPGRDDPGLFHLANAAGTQLATRIAPGEIISLYGPNIGGAATEVYVNNTVATVLYASPNQINAMAPHSLNPPDTADIRIRRGGVDLPVYRVGLVHAAPEIFHTAAGGALLHPDGTWNSETNPARPGGVISLWLTGAAEGSCCTVKVGLLDAEILYAGLAPGYAAGLWQINFRVPAVAYAQDVVTVFSAGVASPAVPILAAIRGSDSVLRPPPNIPLHP